MASAAEQFASNLNFGAFAKATELKKRLWFTLGALIIYRLGTYIPLPGIDPAVLKDIFTQNQGGVLASVVEADVNPALATTRSADRHFHPETLLPGNHSERIVPAQETIQMSV